MKSTIEIEKISPAKTFGNFAECRMEAESISYKETRIGKLPLWGCFKYKVFIL